MKKKIIIRGINGFPIGIAIGFLISLLISAIIGDGNFYPVNPLLMDKMQNEIQAVALQTLMCGILGSVSSMLSVVWNIDNWSIARQNGVYFALLSLINLPIAYIMNWMEHSAWGFIMYFGIFCTIYIVIWLANYFIYKKKIKMINKKVREKQN